MSRWYSNAGLQWKVLLAPAFLVVVFAGVGVFSNHTMRATRTAVQELMAGPVRDAEVVANFNNAAWKGQVQLYRLMATASNEDDAEKIKADSADTTEALDYFAAQFKVLEGTNIRQPSGRQGARRTQGIRRRLPEACRECRRYGRNRRRHGHDADDECGQELFCYPKHNQ